MMHDAPVYLSGYLATEPRFKKVAGDVSSAKLRLAYSARWRNRETGEWSDGPTTFVNVQCWRNLADNVTTCLRKGEPILVFGRLRIRRYNDAEGNARAVTEIEAISVGHDLTRGTAHFSRNLRSSGRWAAETAGEHPGDGHDAGGAAGLPPGAPNGDGVVDEQAVAEFARELSALGPDAVAGPEAAAAGPGTGGDAGDPGDAEDPDNAEDPGDAEAEPAGSARS
jgi:single-strand DNA-binding protein